MTKIKKLFIIIRTRLHLILLILVFNSCSSVKILKQGNGSIVAVSAISNGLGAKGYGLLVTLENIETGEVFKSKSLSPMSPHSVVQNLPSGRYLIRKVDVPVGNLMYSNWSENVSIFFGEIDVLSNSKYYLGDFKGVRKIGKNNVLQLSIENQNIPEKLKAKIENEEFGWVNSDFIKLYPYKEKVLLVF